MRASPDEVANAVRDHYKPVGPSDGCARRAPVTIAVALADKLDTLVGFFAIDEKPTGSKDPYALRRAALGVIRLVLENRRPLVLHSVIKRHHHRIYQRPALAWRLWLKTARGAYFRPECLNTILWTDEDGELHWPDQAQLGSDDVLYVESNPIHPDMVEQRAFDLSAKELFKLGDVPWRMSSGFEVADQLLAFFADRLKVQLREEGRRHDLVDAVFALGDDDLVRITARVEALSAFLSSDDGANLLAGYKRAVNILRAEAKKHPDEHVEGAVDPARFVAPEEQALSQTLAAVSADLERELAAEDWTLAMRSLARLRAPVDAFFDRVLVNDPDPAVRLNRLRLLSTIRDAANRVADFSLIQG